MRSIILAGFLGYLLGAIPTAYLVVRWKCRVDIRSAGSGNVGSLNSYQVSRRRWVGAVVLVADLLKGVGAVAAATTFVGPSFAVAATAGAGAVLGHNYPVWLGFRGGRGLATGAGVMLMLCWWAVVAWGVLWLVAYSATRHVNASNALASLALLAVSVLLPYRFMSGIVARQPAWGELVLFSVCLFSLILLRHAQPVREFVAGRNAERSH